MRYMLVLFALLALPGVAFAECRQMPTPLSDAVFEHRATTLVCQPGTPPAWITDVTLRVREQDIGPSTANEVAASAQITILRPRGESRRLSSSIVLWRGDYQLGSDGRTLVPYLRGTVRRGLRLELRMDLP